MTKGSERRCFWCGDDAQYQSYHDQEWGFPVAEDTRLFEKMCLEGFQAGLSWLTILRKREDFRRVFRGFDIEKVARFGQRDVERLLKDASIVRHRGKIESVINNARCARRLRDEEGSLAAYVWKFEPDPTTRPRRKTRPVLEKITMTHESKALSKDLKSRGFSFVGPTTMYAFMQAMGLVNDHMDSCFTNAAVDRQRRRFKVPSSS